MSDTHQNKLSKKSQIICPELLAPAGGRDAFFAALNTGADAVYLGLKSFSARARAENFTLEELSELIPIAKKFGMKIYVTINILIKQSELESVVHILSALEELEVDGIIIQDVGLIRIAAQYFPNLRLHASTQMAIHNAAGVIEAAKYGIKRVVLARELTLDEISRIQEQAVKEHVEIEVFCHGSLCYSYSGLCLFRGADDERSGNRGECGYTCRQNFSLLDRGSSGKSGYFFSMKDLDSGSVFSRLINVGVSSLKIEGRKKDAQYVSSVVRYYRKLLDNHFGISTLRREAPSSADAAQYRLDEIKNDLKFSFQRATTTFHLMGRDSEFIVDFDNPTHVGVVAGKVASCKQKDRTIECKALCNLEKFDGLRLENGDRDFSLRNMWTNGRLKTSVKAGEKVSLEIPKDIDFPVVGDELFKVRSNELKRRVDTYIKPPKDVKFRSLKYIALHFSCSIEEQGVRLNVEVEKLDYVLLKASHLYQDKTASSKEATKDLFEEVFGVFGAEGFATKQLTVSEDILARSFSRMDLKTFKKEIGVELKAKFAAFFKDRLDVAIKNIRAGDKKRDSRNCSFCDEISYSIKCDDFRIVEYIIENKHLFTCEHKLNEIILEPSSLVISHKDQMQQIFQKAVKADIALRISIPVIVRSDEEAEIRHFCEIAVEVVGNGVKRFEIANLGGFGLLNRWGLLRENTSLTGDFYLYHLNSEATHFWSLYQLERLAFSVEDDFKNIENHMTYWSAKISTRPEVILFKDVSVSISEACALACAFGEKDVVDPNGKLFHVVRNEKRGFIFPEKTYSATECKDRFLKLGIRDYRIDFLMKKYSEHDIVDVLKCAIDGRKIPNAHTGNLLGSLK